MIYLNSAMQEDERSNRGEQIAMFETNHKLRHSSVDAMSEEVPFFFDMRAQHEYSSSVAAMDLD